MSGPQCEATRGDAPWHQCTSAATGIIDIGPEEYWVCAEHGGPDPRVPSTSEGEGT